MGGNKDWDIDENLEDYLNRWELDLEYDYRKYYPYPFTPEVQKSLEEAGKKLAEHFSKTLPKCECGAEKCGYNIHSTWCPRYKE